MHCVRPGHPSPLPEIYRMSISIKTIRRVAIVSSLATVGAAALMSARAASLQASPKTTATTKEPSNHWLEGLKAKHKQFFDNPTPNGGVALVHVMNYYDTYN